MGTKKPRLKFTFVLLKIEGATKRAEAILQFLQAEGYKKVEQFPINDHSRVSSSIVLLESALKR